MVKPCLKQRVVAIIIKDGVVVGNGENVIKNDVKTCPRVGMLSGEGYDKCVSICNQSGHAEVNACLDGGDKCDGATMYIFGHTYICEKCAKICRSSGIIKVIFENGECIKL